MVFLFSDNGTHYIFRKESEGEKDDAFFDRCMFKIKCLKSGYSFHDAECYSHLWVQKQYLKVMYNDEIEKVLYDVSCAN